ncbi:MAG TPA: hypothetical protein VHG91_19580 [Longimicrobium sp.]|nr:hypothetical protein [Longimicrobium sp.]
MGGKKMEGNEEQKRQAARDAHESGKKPSEMGATTGASHQHTDAQSGMSHQQRLDLKKEGKHENRADGDVSEARPGARDSDTPDREKYPRG